MGLEPMVERTPILTVFCYGVLIVGTIASLTPLYLALGTASVASSELNEAGIAIGFGRYLWENLGLAWQRADLGRALFNSLVVAGLVVAGKLVLATLSAYAIVYFRVGYSRWIFWLVLVTIMLPLEVRIVPTFAVASNALGPIQALLDRTGLGWVLTHLFGIRINIAWNLIDTYAGLALPLTATATGTFLFRQFFMTIPPELSEAARLDGAGPLRFFWDILLPLSRTNLAALATLMFLGSWNMYLWPLLVTTDPAMRTAVIAVAGFQPVAGDIFVPEWNLMMAAALIVVVPPIFVIAVAERHFVKGLTGGRS